MVQPTLVHLKLLESRTSLYLLGLHSTAAAVPLALEPKSSVEGRVNRRRWLVAGTSERVSGRRPIRQRAASSIEFERQMQGPSIARWVNEGRSSGLRS